MNTYYSNLIEGHNTRPKDIENAILSQFEANHERRNLQVEARADVRVQAEIDRLFSSNQLPDLASIDFIQWLHRVFYQDAPREMLRIKGASRDIIMQPGSWRSKPEHDVAVGGMYHRPALELRSS
jgi:Fic family protein